MRANVRGYVQRLCGRVFVRLRALYIAGVGGSAFSFTDWLGGVVDKGMIILPFGLLIKIWFFFFSILLTIICVELYNK